MDQGSQTRVQVAQTSAETSVAWDLSPLTTRWEVRWASHGFRCQEGPLETSTPPAISYGLNGSHSNSNNNGLHPNGDGLQPKSDGLQPNSNGCFLMFLMLSLSREARIDYHVHKHRMPGGKKHVRSRASNGIGVQAAPVSTEPTLTPKHPRQPPGRSSFNCSILTTPHGCRLW